MLSAVGVVVHPRRDVSAPLATLERWARDHGVALRRGEVAQTDLVVAIGGDGTVLAALRGAAPAHIPVLGVACGSLGALAATVPAGLPVALDAFVAGAWRAQPLSALVTAGRAGGDDPPLHALNDLVVVRAGAGQIAVDVSVDGVRYARWAGDGLVAATTVGSSAYTLGARGPLLAPGSGAWALTPLAPHGGAVPPLVLGAGSRVDVTISPGYFGARVELDGQLAALPLAFGLTLEPGWATLVALGDEEPFLTGLRRRGIVADSPRILARDRREEAGA